jgi:PKD repeat protein
MIMKTIALSILAFFAFSIAQAQVYTDPAVITADEPVILYFDATGTPLEGYSGDVYTHTGITVNGNTWQYVIGTWGDNSIQPQLTRIDNNLYQLDILPSIRTYYNALPEDEISEICLVFRSEDGWTQTVPDIFYPVFESVFEFIDFSAASTTICENDTVIFTVNDAGAIADSLLWSFPGGIPSTSGEFEPAVYYAVPGTYDVELIAFWHGSSVTLSKEDYIYADELPSIPEQPQGDIFVCFNQHSSIHTTNLVNVIWHLEPAMAGSISYSDSICIIHWNETFYDEAQLRVQSFNNCGTSDFSEALVIEKTENPDTDFTVTPLFIPAAPYEVQFTNLTPNPEQYNFTWHFGNGDTSQETEPKYTYSESGMYSVLLVAHHIETGCSDTLTKADYVQCSAEGISDYRQDGFRYFVNQTSKTLQLIFDEQPNGYACNLLGIDGKYFKTILLTEKVSHLSLNELSPGVYVFMIKADDKQFNGKIIF